MSQDQEEKKWINGEDHALDQILSFDKYPVRSTAQRRKHESQHWRLQTHCEAQYKCLLTVNCTSIYFYLGYYTSSHLYLLKKFHRFRMICPISIKAVYEVFCVKTAQSSVLVVRQKGLKEKFNVVS